jgi:hypothetical protein
MLAAKSQEQVASGHKPVAALKLLDKRGKDGINNYFI